MFDQGPRKYYVHNDIFRYQDEVFSEETSDEPADGTVGKEKYINCFTFLSLKQPFASVSEILVVRFFSTGHYDQNNCSVEYWMF